MSIDSLSHRGVQTPSPGRTDPAGSAMSGYERFRRTRVIHRSHASLVCQGHDTVTAAPVAFKLSLARNAHPAGPPHGPAAEGALLSRLQGHHLPHPLAWGQRDDGREYLMTAWCGGTPLHHLIDQEALATPAHTVALALAVARALGELHRQGLVHGDLSPDNVLLEPRGRVVLVDLGLAGEVGSAPQGETLWGTPAYMAPESWDGQPRDVRADLYALGCILHEAATGTHPFARAAARGVGPLAWAHAHRLAAPDPPPMALGPTLRRLMTDLVARAPSDRPGSWEEVCARLAPRVAEGHHPSL